MRYIKIYRGWRYNKIDKKTDTKINNKQTNWYIKRLPLCEGTKSFLRVTLWSCFLYWGRCRNELVVIETLTTIWKQLSRALSASAR